MMREKETAIFSACEAFAAASYCSHVLHVNKFMIRLSQGYYGIKCQLV